MAEGTARPPRRVSTVSFMQYDAAESNSSLMSESNNNIGGSIGGSGQRSYRHLSSINTTATSSSTSGSKHQQSYRDPSPPSTVRGEGEADFNQGTWMSLISLVALSEMFITVDQTTLWQRHIAWANKGKDIREYNTKRFASNMVFLSLLLASTMAVLMNSAHFSTEIRQALTNELYTSTKYWIGCVLILGACVTVLGIIATYVSWGLISAISDNNSHAILRSSMGQYVCSLPSKFVVGALYLFLVWLLLLIAEIVAGPGRFVLVGLILGLFFQVVISLSAFGRLIIHTGAMGKKRILDPEFERYLLPSGLHASLLIKAKERRRRRTSVTSQYRNNKSPGFRANSSYLDDGSNNSSAAMRRYSSYSQVDTTNFSEAEPLSEGSAFGNYGSTGSQPSPNSSSRTQQSLTPQQNDFSVGETPRRSGNPSVKPRDRLSTDEKESIMRALKVFGGPEESGRVFTSDPVGETPMSRKSLESVASIQSDNESVDDLVNEIQFPRPSMLNRVGGSHGELHRVVQSTLSQSFPNMNGDGEEEEEGVDTLMASLPPRPPVEVLEHANKVDDFVDHSTPKSTLTMEEDHFGKEEKTDDNRESSQFDLREPSPSPPQQHFFDAKSQMLSASSLDKPGSQHSHHSHSKPQPQKLQPPQQPQPGLSPMEELARRRSAMLYRQSSHRSSKRQIRQEWREEDDVRDMYGVEPPIDFFADIDDDALASFEDDDDHAHHRHHYQLDYLHQSAAAVAAADETITPRAGAGANILTRLRGSVTRLMGQTSPGQFAFSRPEQPNSQADPLIAQGNDEVVGRPIVNTSKHRREASLSRIEEDVDDDDARLAGLRHALSHDEGSP